MQSSLLNGEIAKIAKAAREASRVLATLSSENKNRALLRMSDELIQEKETLILENRKDLE